MMEYSTNSFPVDLVIIIEEEIKLLKQITISLN